MQKIDTNWRAGEPRDLGNGLRLRWSRVDDTEAIFQLAGQVFRNHATAPFNADTAGWILDLMSGEHPLMGPDDFLLVEDLTADKPEPVAITCYWHHTWEYGGIPFRVGRPEIVATQPAYRQRGLVRALFEELHKRSQAEGDLTQVITGIPYFYRQFGYEYALDLSGGRMVPLVNIPAAHEGQEEPFLLRDASEDDIPLLMSLYERSTRDEVVRTRIEESWWRYQLSHWQASHSGEHWHIQMIIDRTQKVWGYLITPARRFRTELGVWSLALAPDANGLLLLPSVLRAVRDFGLNMPVGPEAGQLSGLNFTLNQQHPLCALLDTLFAARPSRPYAWYVRVPDLPGFLRKITPVLEQRLAASPLAGYSGELRLDFFRSGLRLAFDRGLLVSTENWQRPAWPGEENASFPPQVFLQLLMGYRGLDELFYAFPDVQARDEVALVLRTLFPRQPSFVLPQG